MGFFKDFKDDFSEAVNELMPGGAEDDMLLATPEQPEDDVDVTAELGKLDGLLEQASKRVFSEPDTTIPEEPAKDDADDKADDVSASLSDMDIALDEPKAEPEKEEPKTEPMKVFDGFKKADEPKAEEKPASTQSFFGRMAPKKEEKMEETFTAAAAEPAAPVQEEAPRIASDENAVITSGMSIKGDLTSTGSIEIQGRIEGDVDCNGKLTITGTVIGNSRAAEFYADSAHVTGEVNTSGTAKVGLGSVIVGNISATSAVIAGAVKGDIDVRGPVVVDTSAVIMGNIKSRSVQINNGAVIEGFCSQTYAEVDVDKLFG